MKAFDIHLSSGLVQTVTLADSMATRSWFMAGLSPTGWICTDELENFNMAHVVAIVPHLGLAAEVTE